MKIFSTKTHDVYAKKTAKEVKEKWRGRRLEQRKDAENLPLREKRLGVERNQMSQRLPQPK